MRRYLIALLLFVLLIGVPILLRKESSIGGAHSAEQRLVIVTPHNESIRAEFGEAFAVWWKKKTGKSVYVDWRTPGGGAEIRRMLDGAFHAAKETGREGVGIDVMFGGGDYEFRQQAEQGRLAPLAVFAEHPEWFHEEVIPQKFTGETYYDADRRWVGVCLSQFGICFNRDVLKRLGLPEPTRWEDLADPRYAGMIALADPGKSASVGRAFEMLLQQQLQESLAQGGYRGDALERGWRNGLRLIQRIAANARYFTDSASKIPRDVAQGDAAAGMCVDFYGRSFEEALMRPDGSSRIGWNAPQSGTSVSVDPVAVFIGAPEEKLAQAFVTFCLSEEGQLLWNAKAKTPGGPRDKSLRRLPVRKDIYTEGNLAHFSDPEALPYERSGGFIYQTDLTMPMGKALRLLIPAMAIDSHDELKSAWGNIRTHGMPERAIDAMGDLTGFGYHELQTEVVPQLRKSDVVMQTRLANEWGQTFRVRYRHAESISNEPNLGSTR